MISSVAKHGDSRWVWLNKVAQLFTSCEKRLTVQYFLGTFNKQRSHIPILGNVNDAPLVVGKATNK